MRTAGRGAQPCLLPTLLPRERPRGPSRGRICLLTVPSPAGTLKKQMAKGAGRRRLPAAAGRPAGVAVSPARGGEWQGPHGGLGKGTAAVQGGGGAARPGLKRRGLGVEGRRQRGSVGWIQPRGQRRLPGVSPRAAVAGRLHQPHPSAASWRLEGGGEGPQAGRCVEAIPIALLLLGGCRAPLLVGRVRAAPGVAGKLGARVVCPRLPHPKGPWLGAARWGPPSSLHPAERPPPCPGPRVVICSSKC